jgi:peptide/nickel transport system substrate-binding protein
MTMRRRTFVAALFATLAPAARAHALGRVPTKGEIRVRLPFAAHTLDPHDLFDPLAAIFGSAVFDSAYARDNRGRIHPGLADGMPAVVDGKTVVRMRSGMRSAQGKPIAGRELAWSVARARKGGAAGMLAEIDPLLPRSDDKDPLLVHFGTIDPDKLALLLASPLTAVVPVGYAPAAPDGTGAFAATLAGARLDLARNQNAARGPGYLERILVGAVADLSESLRAFEAGEDDLGWLGQGLHKNRQGARKFDFGAVGWVVLATGNRAGAFAAPGMAQQLANDIPIDSLFVGLRAPPGGSGTPWTGGPAALLVDESAGQLRAVAEAVAAKMSQPGHEVTPNPVSRAALRAARTSGDHALAIDFVRHPDSGPHAPLLALATADRVELGREVVLKPPRTAERAPHEVTRTLRLGVLGGLTVHGGVVPGVTLAPSTTTRGIDWANSFRSS